MNVYLFLPVLSSAGRFGITLWQRQNAHTHIYDSYTRTLSQNGIIIIIIYIILYCITRCRRCASPREEYYSGARWKRVPSVVAAAAAAAQTTTTREPPPPPWASFRTRPPLYDRNELFVPHPRFSCTFHIVVLGCARACVCVCACVHVCFSVSPSACFFILSNFIRRQKRQFIPHRRKRENS